MLKTTTAAIAASCQQYAEYQGKSLQLITLDTPTITVQLINLGATITAIYTPDKRGLRKNVVAGFADSAAYRYNPAYFGCIVGRYANRIAGGSITVAGKHYQLSVNNDNNHLHGGFDGFHTKVWQVVQCDSGEQQGSVTMEYVSRDGEEGYPGNLSVRVQYTLDAENRLHILYTAQTDKRTPVSLTNHSYFNLTGFDDPLVTGHLLQINARAYTEKNAANIPTGNILPVAGTPLDFILPVPLGKNINALPADGGFDHNYVLQPSLPGTTPAATLEDPVSGRVIQIFTDQPGIQLYSSNYWDGSIIGQQGKPYLKHGAIALETQAFPDSPNHAHFPDTILAPGSTYRRTTVYAFDVR
jgi:aldose 1-epimerase